MRRRPLIYPLFVPFGLMCNYAAAQEPLPKINPDGLTSAKVCGECHQAIHAVWQHSLHSNAWSNAIFQAGYRRTVDYYGSQKARVCLSCHAPTVRHTKDYLVKEPITAEGVTCDFCHSVNDVNLDDPIDPVRLNVGEIKYGPLRKAESPAHKVSESILHTRSEFCAACHEYRNVNGLTVLGTYSEWKASPYAKRGVQCQHCHMPLVPGRVAALKAKDKTNTSVNLHNISGSHDLERVRKAITLKLINTDWTEDQVWVSLEVANVGSGHCFPTGLPMHKAVLEVTLRNPSREVARREIPFSVIMMDDKGRRIEHEHEVFLKAAKVQMDTRIKPEEVRAVDITFRDVKKARRLILSASLFYEYTTETLVTDQQGERIEPAEMKFLVASVKKTLRLPPKR